MCCSDEVEETEVTRVLYYYKMSWAGIYVFFGRVVLYSFSSRKIPSMVMLDMVILATVLLWRANTFSLVT